MELACLEAAAMQTGWDIPFTGYSAAKSDLVKEVNFRHAMGD